MYTWNQFQAHICNFKSNQSEENVLSYKFDSVCDQECPKECGSTKFDERVDNFEYTSHPNDSLSIHVYYSDLSYIMISQTPKTTRFSLLNEIGGALSLFVGVTFLSLLEFFEYFFEIFFVFYRKLSTGK